MGREDWTPAEIEAEENYVKEHLMADTFEEIDYVCPKCGGKVVVTTIDTYPPITCYRCQECDYHHDEQRQIAKVRIVAPKEVRLDD